MLDINQFDQINPPARLLMGPGPINADPGCCAPWPPNWWASTTRP